MPVKDQGANKERFMLIPRTLIFILRGENVLLLRGGPRKRLWADRYNGIGGHVEMGEDILSAAHRELKEETGLIPDDLWLCMTVTIDTAQNPGIVLFVYKGECLHGEPHPSSEGILEWVNIHSLSTIQTVEDLPIIVERIVAMRKGDPPISVHYSYNSEGNLSINFHP